MTKRAPNFVMAGLVPAIHALLLRDKKDVDARDKRGHDGPYCSDSLITRSTKAFRSGIFWLAIFDRASSFLQ